MMRTYWAFVSIGVGAFIRVTIQADNAFDAYQQLRIIYGSALMSNNANLLQ